MHGILLSGEDEDFLENIVLLFADLSYGPGSVNLYEHLETWKSSQVYLHEHRVLYAQHTGGIQALRPFQSKHGPT